MNTQQIKIHHIRDLALSTSLVLQGEYLIEVIKEPSFYLFVFADSETFSESEANYWQKRDSRPTREIFEKYRELRHYTLESGGQYDNSR